MNYEGLNENMIAVSSPSAQPPPTPFYQYDSQTEAYGATRLGVGGIKSKIYVGLSKNIVINGTAETITVGTSNQIVIDAATQQITVGSSGNLTIDGANARILMNDGTTNRVLIGSI